MIKNLFVSTQSLIPDLAVFISPTFHSGRTSDGAYKTPTFTGSAVGGTAPYTFSWVIDEGQVNNPDSDKTTCTLSGNSEEVFSTLTLTVTDSSLETATATTNIAIIFGALQ